MNVKERLNFSEEVASYYSNELEDKLKQELINLTNKMEEFFKSKVIEDGKELNNSVDKSILPFEYKTRVKSKESLEEKIIRNNIHFEDISVEDILDQFDDLIGITIVTTTMGYQELAYEYLEKFIEENRNDLCLVSAKNNVKSLFGNDDIKYYHLKLTFNDYPVEIQIKSTFLSAFADIEHNLFYKNHDIYGIKKYNKNLMHSLAPILIDLETILHDIYTHDKKDYKYEVFKEEVYEFLIKNKPIIFGIEKDEDKNKLNYILKNATEIICVCYKDNRKNILSIKEIKENQDLKIISFLYKNSMEFFVISKLLNEQSSFFNCYLKNKLKNNKNYKDKIDVIEDLINEFIETLEYMSDYDDISTLQISSEISLEYVFDKFVTHIEKFYEDFQDLIEDKADREFYMFINTFLIIPYLVEEKEGLNKYVSLVDEYLDDLEESEYIESTHEIKKYIIERWN